MSTTRISWEKERCTKQLVREIRPLINQLIEAGADINAGDYQGYAPIHHAVLAGNKITVSALLRTCDIEVSKADGIGCTSLDWAVARDETSIVSCLLHYGATHSPNYDVTLRAYVISSAADIKWHDWPLVLGLLTHRAEGSDENDKKDGSDLSDYLIPSLVPGSRANRQETQASMNSKE